MRNRFAGLALAGLVLGGIAITLVTAILVSAVTSSQAAADLRTATTQLNQIQRADAAAEQARAERSAKVTAQLAALHRQNDAAMHQAAIQRHYLAVLAHVLRSHGIPVPPPPRDTVTPAPKGPRRSHPANLGHTAHGPRSPSTSPTCLLIPQICLPPVSVPTLLP